MIRNSFLRQTLLIITSALVGCYSLALAFQWPDWIHGSNWVWTWHAPQFLAERWGWLAALAGFTLFVWWGAGQKKAWNRRQQGLLLAWAVLWTSASQLIFASMHSATPVFAPIAMKSGFFQEGVRLEAPLALIQTYPAQMPQYRDVHLRTQPPGWILAYWSASRVWEQFPTVADKVGRWLLRYDCLEFELQGLAPTQLAAGSLPLLVLLLTGLGTLPFYGLGRRFLGERLARQALVFYPFWPGLLVFIGRFDGVYAVLALLVLWLSQVTIERGGKWGWLTAVSAGLLLASGTWFGFGVLSLLLLVNCILLAQLALGTVNRREGSWGMVRLNGCFLGALILLWGSLWLFWQVSGPAMFNTSQQLHATFRINYPFWPLFNLYDLAVFMGIILFVGVLLTLGKIVLSKQDWQHGDALALGWAVSILILNLSGQVRAETGRLWLLVMGPGLLAGIWGWHRLLGTQRRWQTVVFITFWLQAAVTTLFLGGRMASTSVPPPLWDLPAAAVPLDYQLGQTLALQGYELHQEANTLYINLYWQALDFPRADYSVLAHLVGQDGTILAQNDGTPHHNNLPTWCWVPGEVVTDERSLSLVDGERPSHVLVGMYEWHTGQRLPVLPPVANDTIPLPLPLE